MKEIDTKTLVRRMSVKNRITLMVILISVFPILVISVYSYTRAYLSVESTAKAYAPQALRSASRDICAAVQAEALFLPEFLAAPDGLPRFPETGARDAAGAAVFQPGVRRYVKAVRITSAAGEPLYEWGACPPEWEDPARGTASWELLPDGQGSSIALHHPLTGADGTPAGFARVLFSPELLTAPLQLSQNDSYNRFVLIDRAGGTLIGDSSRLSVLEKAAVAEVCSAPRSAVPMYVEKGRGNFTYHMQVPSIDWTLVLTAPYTEMMKPIQGIFFATLLCTILLLNFSVVVIDSIDRPMNALVRSFGNAAKMNFEVELQDESLDELGVLSVAYNDICQQMKETLRKVEKEQNDKRVAEIRMLQAQINPHFLFNTLDSLRFASLMSNVPTVSNGLAALSHILRGSILRDGSYITFEQEVQNVEDYLTLQKLRSCELIRLHREIEPELLRASIMKLLLQPIVENAVIHGLRENQPLDIVLRARLREGRVHVEISDNGRGFDQEQVPKSEDGLPRSSKKSGIGLSNVRDRLYLAYKENQSFGIESAPGRGTTVRITMPYAPWEEPSDV